MNNIILKLASKVGFGWASTIIYGAVAAVILSGLMYSYHWAAENGRNEVRIEWAKETAAIKEATATQKLNNALKKMEGVAAAKEIEIERGNTLKRLNLAEIDRDTLKKQIGVLNATFKTKLNDTSNNWATRLQLESVNSATRLREESSVAEGLAASASECYGRAADWRTLTNACRLTTIDFNSCREALDNDTKTVGREN